MRARSSARIYSVHTSILRPLDAKLADQLAAEFGVTDPAKILRGQQILSGEIFQALGQIKREIDDFLAREGERAVTESEELAFDVEGRMIAHDVEFFREMKRPPS